MNNRDGFTLAEIMVSLMIFMISMQMLMMGGDFNLQLKKRNVEWKNAAASIEELVDTKEDCIAGTVTLYVEEYGETSKEGWLYCGKPHHSEESTVDIIYVELSDYEMPENESDQASGSNAEEGELDES